MAGISAAQVAKETKAAELAKAQREAENQARHNREVAERETRRANEGKGKTNPLTAQIQNQQSNTTETWNPGEENAAPEPFLTQQDIEEYAEAREQYEAGLHELDENYSNKSHEVEYESANIEKNRIGEVDNENWDAASRGLFKSSIRDGDLADIDATAEIKKTFLSNSLTALKVYNEGQKTAMEAKWGRYQEGLKRKEVENAQGVAQELPKWKVEPHMETSTTTPATPKVQTQPKKPKTVIVNDDIPALGGKKTSPSSNSANGGVTAPASNPSVSNRQKANASAARGAIKGQLYG